LNYGTNFGRKEKVSLMLQQVLNSEEVKQSRAKEVTGNLFNRYNAVEERAK
jgi:iron complex outermembrane receptor protein